MILLDPYALSFNANVSEEHRCIIGRLFELWMQIIRILIKSTLGFMIGNKFIAKPAF